MNIKEEVYDIQIANDETPKFVNATCLIVFLFHK